MVFYSVVTVDIALRLVSPDSGFISLCKCVRVQKMHLKPSVFHVCLVGKQQSHDLSLSTES